MGVFISYAYPTYQFTIICTADPTVRIVSGITISPGSSVPIGTSVFMKTTLSEANISTGKWTKNGVELSSGANIQMFPSGNEQTLIIVRTTSASAGTYTYTIGSETTSATLVVTGGSKGMFAFMFTFLHSQIVTNR